MEAAGQFAKLYNKFNESGDVGFIANYVALSHLGGHSLLGLKNIHAKDLPNLPNKVIGSDLLESSWTYVWRDSTSLSNLNITLRPWFCTIDGDTMKIVTFSKTPPSFAKIQALIDD